MATPAEASAVHSRAVSLSLVPARCCTCEDDDAVPIAVGEDFEYHTTDDTFLAVRCRGCGLVYLNPRPSPAERERIAPPHGALESSRDGRWWDARPLLRACEGLPQDACILEAGRGESLDQSLLRQVCGQDWRVDTVDPATLAGLRPDVYDLALLIGTLEQVEDPPELLRVLRLLLKPGGCLLVVTENTDSLAFRLFQGRQWGGYHFPRRSNLWNPASLRALARKTDFEVRSLTTAGSAANWVPSIRQFLLDYGAPGFVVERFRLSAMWSPYVFGALDALAALAGRGSRLRAVLQRAE